MDTVSQVLIAAFALVLGIAIIVAAVCLARRSICVVDEKPCGKDKKKHKKRICDDYGGGGGGSCRRKYDCEKKKECPPPCHERKRDDDHCEESTPGLFILGMGCAGSQLAYVLSKQCLQASAHNGRRRHNYSVTVFEAGDDLRQYILLISGTNVVSTNLALNGSTVAIGNAPLINTFRGNYVPLTFQPPWTKTTNLVPLPVPGQANWNQGIMWGGSMEHIQGLSVNPSPSRLKLWAEVLEDSGYEHKHMWPKIKATEAFRVHTNPVTTDVGDLYAPYDGDSAAGSFPIERGTTGRVQTFQSRSGEYGAKLGGLITAWFTPISTALKLQFVQTPVVSPVKGESYTFNSGVDANVNLAPEVFVDTRRVRVSTFRAYLGPDVITKTTASTAVGNEGFDLKVHGVNAVYRIVFQTKEGQPPGQLYWPGRDPQYTKATDIDVNAFVRPLTPIGIELRTVTNTGTSAVPKWTETFEFKATTRVVCTMGTLATPLVLMHSGIGDKTELTSWDIPVLFNQPNMGKHAATHSGAALRFKLNDVTKSLGSFPIPDGIAAPHAYLPSMDGKYPRKFQLFTGIVDSGVPTDPYYTISIYDLNPYSTGYISMDDSKIDPNFPSVLNYTVQSNLFSHPRDKQELVWVYRQLMQMVLAHAPTATFYTSTNVLLPILPSDSDDVLFNAFIVNFVAQSHWVGTCGMGTDPATSCVDPDFRLRGTRNVWVCDGSSTPLMADDGALFPLQNDGNTTRGLAVFAIRFADKLGAIGTA